MSEALDRILCPHCKHACDAESWLVDVCEGLAACPVCEGQVPLRKIMWRIRPGDRLKDGFTVEATGYDWVVARHDDGKVHFWWSPEIHEDLQDRKLPVTP